jgi:hypothetical protein
MSNSNLPAPANDSALPELPAGAVLFALPAPANDSALPELPAGAVLFAPPRLVESLRRDLTRAAAAARKMPPRRQPRADVKLDAYTVAVITADNPAEAFREAARWWENAPGAEIHATSWSRVPGPAEGEWEVRLTLQVSFKDPDGEHTGDTHHSSRPR